MKEFEIKFSDIHRILIGDVPYHFYLEVIFRVAFIYLILMVSLRLMGKRMSTQLGRNEMAAVTSLAAAIGVPLMSPDRGLLPAVVIAAVIITFQILIAKKASTNKKFESFTQDKYNMLVKDGVLDTKAMMSTRVSRDRVFSQLRSESISNLGEVKRLYFEAGGSFSILAAENPKPGLSVLPEWDVDMSSDMHQSVDQEICGYCGYQDPGPVAAKEKVCGNCQHKDWVSAVTLLE
ncbi:MAG: YetF domain-containing protein [Pedobacter sp.]